MARIPVQHLYRLLGLFLFVSAGLVFGDPVFAGENDSGYTLDRCIDLAVENNLGLKKEMLDMKTAGEADENLWSLFLPSINLQGGVNYSKTLFTESTMPGQEPFSYSAGASLSLQLNTGIAAEIRKTSAAYHLAEISYEAARSNIISTVSTEFFRLLLAEREIELLQEDLELAGRQSEMNTIRFENGRINERTLLQSKLNVETAKLSLSKKRSAYRLDKRSFLNILGLKEEIQLLGKIEVQLVDFDTQAVIDQYLAKRTDIRSQEMNIRRLEAAAEQASAARAPSLSLSGQWSGSTTDFNKATTKDSVSVGVSVNIPLDGWIPGSRDDLDVRGARREVEKARLSLQDVREAAKLEIQNIAADLRQREQEIEISRLQVDIAERAFELAEEGFQRGTVESLELEEIRKDLLSARKELLNGKYNYLTALNKLKTALNLEDISELESKQP